MVEPYRKPAVISTFNRVSGMVRGKRPIDADKLILQARRKANLHDLGNDFNETGYRVFIDSVNREARLHPFGKFMLSEKIRSQLVNLLWVNNWLKKHPSILDQPVLPVILISGLQRTGTTKMQRLLSLQDGARGLSSWEALFPAPLGDRNEKDKRIRQTRRNEKALKFISPVFHAIHPVQANAPEEDILLMDLNFMSSSAEAILNVPSYAEWLHKNCTPESTYRFEAKLLKLLQWQQSGKFWVLKSPHHLEFLTAFKNQLPLRGLIWMHRKPEVSISSFMSMLFYGRSIFSDDVREQEIISHWLPKVGQMLNSGMKFRTANPELVHDIEFEDLMDDSAGEIIKIGKKFPGIFGKGMVIPDESYKSTHRYKRADWNIHDSLWDETIGKYERQHYGS